MQGPLELMSGWEITNCTQANADGLALFDFSPILWFPLGVGRWRASGGCSAAVWPRCDKGHVGRIALVGGGEGCLMALFCPVFNPSKKGINTKQDAFATDPLGANSLPVKHPSLCQPPHITLSYCFNQPCDFIGFRMSSQPIKVVLVELTVPRNNASSFKEAFVRKTLRLDEDLRLECYSPYNMPL